MVKPRCFPAMLKQRSVKSILGRLQRSRPRSSLHKTLLHRLLNLMYGRAPQLFLFPLSLLFSSLSLLAAPPPPILLDYILRGPHVVDSTNIRSTHARKLFSTSCTPCSYLFLLLTGGSESGIDITHFLVGLGDTVTVIDPSEPWARRESDSSYGLSPYTFDRLRALQATGKVTFIAERAESITPTEIKTKTQTIKLTNPPIDATGFDISKSLAGQLFKFQDGIPNITRTDESTICKNVFLVGPHVQHQKAVFCFIYKYRQRFAVVAKEILERLRSMSGMEVIQQYARKNFLMEDLSECGNACPC